MPPPIWLEGRIAAEYVWLLRDPLYRGVGVPRGHGRPILLIPGFMAGDRSLHTMHSWLRRVGYQAELPGIRLNVLYSEIMIKRLLASLERLHEESGQKVGLVGHSRGGALAKVLAHRHPELVSQVIAMGSPLADVFDVHPVTMAGVRAAHLLNSVRFGRSATVERRFLRDLEARARVPLTSIYSKSDGIVSWRACLRGDATCLEVDSSHVGMGVNLGIYRLLARLLPAPAERSAATS